MEMLQLPQLPQREQAEVRDTKDQSQSVRIKAKKPYRGFARSLFIEDLRPVEASTCYGVPGEGAPAYLLAYQHQEVKMHVVEQVVAHAQLFRIASFPVVNKEDLTFVQDLGSFAVSNAQEGICRLEDERVVTLLLAAIEDYAKHPNHTISPNHTIKISGILSSRDYYDLEAKIKLHELDVDHVLVNPVDAVDFKYFEIDATLIESVVVPEGTIILAPAAGYLGVLPTKYRLEVEANHMVTLFQKGWVVDELIGLLVLNPRGLGVIFKK